MAAAGASSPIQHLVLFRLAEEPSQELEEEMRRQIRSWAKPIAGLTRLRFGRETGGRSSGYQFGLLTEFADRQALEAYLAHPLHQSFLAWVQARPFELIRFDYPLDATTSLLEPSSD
ncbi:MAG: Dabb family protein [Candidatus Dormibacteria bacterium]